MNISEYGINLIKQFEGCKHKAYRDQVGVLTIGYGHTGPEVVDGLIWTQEECDNQLAKDLNEFSHDVAILVGTAILTQGQFDALCSFAYNLGANALKRSTLLAKTLNGDIDGAAEQFAKWDLAGGKVDLGLSQRRQAEKELFLS